MVSHLNGARDFFDVAVCSALLSPYTLYISYNVHGSWKKVDTEFIQSCEGCNVHVYMLCVYNMLIKALPPTKVVQWLD